MTTREAGKMQPLKRGLVGRSIAWSSSASAFARIAQLLIGIIVARIMTTHDFGVFAVVLVVFMIVINISELGVGTALIRERDNIDRMAPTAVTLSLVTSAILAAGMWAASPGLAQLLGTPEAALPLALMAIVVLLAGPSAVPAALLTRDFQQGRRFSADMANLVVSNVVLIVMAAMGWGVMAFVWSRIAGQLVSVIMLLVLAPKLYLPGFKKKEAVHLLKFGLPITGSSLIGYLVSSVDVVSIGRALGPVQLGVYNLANNVSNWPPSLFSSVIDSVGLPVFARVHHDLALLNRYLLNAVRVVGSTFFFITAMCVGVAQPLVNSLYGQKWESAGPVLSFFAIYGSLQVLIALFVVVIIACNAPRSVFWAQVVWLIALIPAMVLGVMWGGIIGAAIANISVTAFIVIPLNLWQMRRASGIRILPVLLAMWRPLAAAVLAGIVAHVVSLPGDHAWVSMILGGLAGAAVYFLILFRWVRGVITETKGLYAKDKGEPENEAVEETEAEEAHDEAEKLPELTESDEKLILVAQEVERSLNGRHTKPWVDEDER